MYITNNIVESINSKINFYLPKKVTSNIDFVKSLTNLIVKSKFNNNEGKRKDFITRSIIVIINKFNLNTNPKWINCEEFKNVLTIIIKQNENYDNSNDLELLINDYLIPFFFFKINFFIFFIFFFFIFSILWINKFSFFFTFTSFFLFSILSL